MEFALNINGKDLAKMTEHLPGVEMFFLHTPASLGMRSSVVRSLEILDGDDDLLQQLAVWLMGKDSVTLPECLASYRLEMEQWRRWLKGLER